MNQEAYIHLLKQEVVPALGCTEPIAVSFGASQARSLMKEDPDQINLSVSRNILKNAMGVSIPGTGAAGLELAAALGTFGGDKERGLEVLASLTKEAIAFSKKFVEKKVVHISVAETDLPIYINIELKNERESAQVIIETNHTHITSMSYNNREIFKEDKKFEEKNLDEASKEKMSVKEIYDFACHVPLDNILFILQAAVLNQAASEEGLKNHYGLEVGRTLKEAIDSGVMGESLETLSAMVAAAASDARMGGCTLPVMSNSGSGNQGITATLPVLVAANFYKKSEEELARALVLSHLISIHIKHHIGRLSALCGAIIAATGASCGITCLMGGAYKEMVFAINNMVGDIAGMICDGAKNSCALKISTSVKTAVMASTMAMKGISVTGKEGIITDDIEKTIENLGTLCTAGMHETDHVILDMMVNKSLT